MTLKTRLLFRFGLATALAAFSLTWLVAPKSLNQAQPVTVTEVLTQHNDNDRTGHNPNETVLTPETVNKDNFGKLFDLEVDGLIYAQPLVVSGVTVAGKNRNLLLTVTQHNSLYCFDADTGEKLWSRNFTPNGMTTVPTPNQWWNQPGGFYRDLTPEVGINSTPVVDRETNTIYLSHITWDQSVNPPKVTHWLRAVDLVTKQDKFGSPIAVTGSVPLRGQDAIPIMSRHGLAATLEFVPGNHLQRPALLLSNGRVLLGYGGHFDSKPFQGWVFSYNSRQLTQTPLIWGSTAGGQTQSAPGYEGGIWQAGMGLTTDQDGSVFLMTGNGDFSQSMKLYADSLVRLSDKSGSLQAEDSFTPCNQSCLEQSDADLGSSGVLHIPGTDFIVGGGKQARLYLLDRKKLGGYSPLNHSIDCSNKQDFNCANSNVLQEIQVGCNVAPAASQAIDTPCSLAHVHDDLNETHHIHGSPVFWRSANRGAVLYVWAENDVLRAIPFDEIQKRFVSANKTPITVAGCGDPTKNPMDPWTTSLAKSPGYFAADKPNQFAQLHQGMTGGMLSISSNQGRGGIVWAVTPTNNDANQKVVPGILRAYDADNLKRELWNSYQVRERDDFGNFAKHMPPTVANGKVYLATFSKHLSVYGLKPKPVPVASVNLIQNGGFEQPSQAGWTATGETTINHAYPYYDSNQGAICPTQFNDGSWSQTVTVPEAGTYTLTAYCATNILPGNIIPPSNLITPTLSVTANGKAAPGSPAKIAPYLGYQKQTIVFSAIKGSRVTVTFYAPKVQPISNFTTSPGSQPPSYALIDAVTLVKSSLR